MSVIASDCRKIIQFAAPFAVGLLLLSASHATSQAESGHTLVIPSSDGYGFDDCLSANKACGHVIADAWCEAHGMSGAVSFGRAEDVTASIGETNTAKIDPSAFIVTCKG